MLNGTQLGGTTVRLSWGRSPSSKQVIDDSSLHTFLVTSLAYLTALLWSMDPYVFVCFDSPGG